MAHETVTNEKPFHLPISVVTVADLGRMIAEIEALDDFLQQASIRKPGSSMTLPKTTKQCEELIEENGLNILQTTDRKYLLEFLTKIREKAPVLHISFSAEPSAKVLQKLVSYVRKDIHPVGLLSVGLQPTIGAGCVLRTTNKYFDFTLRKSLETKRNDLIQYIGSHNKQEATK
jgi:hypothetical protein